MKRVRGAAGALACLSLLVACSEDRDIAAASSGGVHPVGIDDPASPDWHGTLLANEHWSGMLDPNANDACGRCHAGSPAPVPGITSFAPGATACTSCHTEPAGPLACDTCHQPDATHVAHIAPGPFDSTGLPCSTCHPIPGDPIIGGLHGDGVVEVIFDSTRVTGEASWNDATQACAVSCHDLGGTWPRPKWSAASPMVCGDCHLSPPASHFAGPCTECHAEANATGTALSGGPLHMNGRVDLGNGNGTCGACHGVGSSPWPTTGAHPSHQSPSISNPVACASCHVVPTTVLSPGHLDGPVRVAFSGLALARSSSPAWDGAGCSGVACHGANLPGSPAVLVPQWLDTSGAAAACGACHGIPPTQHTPSTSCGQSNCHGAEITEDSTGALSISPEGLPLHINGVIDVAQ